MKHTISLKKGNNGDVEIGYRKVNGFTLDEKEFPKIKPFIRKY